MTSKTSPVALSDKQVKYELLPGDTMQPEALLQRRLIHHLHQPVAGDEVVLSGARDCGVCRGGHDGSAGGSGHTSLYVETRLGAPDAKRCHAAGPHMGAQPASALRRVSLGEVLAC